MDALAPDFSRYWLPAKAGDHRAAAQPPRVDEATTPALLEELEALVERVNAARCIF